MMLAGVKNRREGRRGLLALLLGIVVLSSLPTPVCSQSASASRAYRVGGGDVLQVDVVGRADISGQFTVDEDGAITLPILGTVAAAGRTTTELGTDISRRVSLISRDIPQVTVSVLQTFRRKSFVLGAVLLPGSYSFAKPPTVWEAISEAGGPAEDADLSAVQIISESEITPTIVDLAAAVQTGALTSLPRLRPGDTVRVPRREGAPGAVGNVVYVFGAVAVQGSLPLSEASDLVRAIIRSGPTADANLMEVEIVRKSGPRIVSMKVNMKDYLGAASLVGNPQLQSDDTVYLPRRREGPSQVLRIAGAVLGFVTTIAILNNNINN